MKNKKLNISALNHNFEDSTNLNYTHLKKEMQKLFEEFKKPITDQNIAK